MANTVVWMDGFENMPATLRFPLYLEASTYYGSTAGHAGGNAMLMCGPNNWVISRTLPAPTLGTTWRIAAFMYRRPATAAAGTTTYLQVGFGNSASATTTTACRSGLYIAADGSIGVRKDATTYGTSAVGIISPDLWYHIEYRHRYGNATTGNFEVRVNGTSVLTGVGDNSGVANQTVVGFQGSPGTTGTGKGHYFDDVIVATSTDASPAWFGISKVRHLPPTSTSTGQWLGSDGDSVNNHLLVDDIDAASTDWVTSTAGAGLRDLYGHAAATSGATIHAMQMRAAAGLDVIGTDAFSLLVKSGATESVTAKTLGTGTPVWFEGPVLNTDPATAAAWTKAGFDASLFGVKS